MHRIRRQQIDTKIEKDSMIGMIISDNFIKEAVRFIKPELFSIDYNKTLFKWISTYWDNYGVSPGKEIQNIFEYSKPNLEESESNLIAKFLTELSETYVEEETVFNTDYHLDKAEEYFKKRNIQLFLDKTKAVIEDNDINEAEAMIARFSNISRETTKWINPFDNDVIERVFSDEDKELFRLPGILGDLIGPVRRSWLGAVMAPNKRGKTNFLYYFAMMAAASRLRVNIISLEMEESDLCKRLYKGMTSMRDEDDPEDILIPVFDCEKNQTGFCDLPERTNDYMLLNDEGEIPQYDPYIPYKPCDYCRQVYPNDRTKFVPAVWYTMLKRDHIRPNNVVQTVRKFRNQYGKDPFRIMPYPMNSANLKRIKNDLDILEYSEGFVGDVIITDYADILGPEDSRIIGRDSINETWKELKALAQERSIFHMTATQANRLAIESNRVKQTNTGEDIRKLNHLDFMAVLNQTIEEKRAGYMRIGLIAHRHKQFDELMQVTTLQNLKIGQFVLDSAWTPMEGMI